MWPACGRSRRVFDYRPTPAPLHSDGSEVCEPGGVPRIVGPVLLRGSLADRPQPTLADDELILRPWMAHDAPEVVEAYSDPAIRHWHLRSMTLSEAEGWVVAANRDWIEETAASWAVTTLGGKLTGRMTLGAINLKGGSADVRYWVLPGARGRGIASRALNVLTLWAGNDLGLHRLELEHSTRNPASCRVAEKAGYALEGTRRSQLLHDDGWHDMHLHARLSQRADVR